MANLKTLHDVRNYELKTITLNLNLLKSTLDRIGEETGGLDPLYYGTLKENGIDSLTIAKVEKSFNQMLEKIRNQKSE